MRSYVAALGLAGLCTLSPPPSISSLHGSSSPSLFASAEAGHHLRDGSIAELKKAMLVRQHKPFRERLEGLLAGDASGYVTAEEVEAAEEAILSFNIPRLTVVDLLADYIPVAWKGGDANNALNSCPKCILRLKRGNSISEIVTADTVDEASLDAHLKSDVKAADALINVACPSSPPKRTRTAPPQITIGGCGESQAGTGSGYYAHGMSKFELNAGFYPEADPLSMTFHRRELSLPEWGLTTVASQVEYLLRPPEGGAPAPPHLEHRPLMFTHGNCGGSSGRGSLIKALIDIDDNLLDRWGKCWRNRQPSEVEPQKRGDWFWHDSEGNRDATKTTIAARYMFTSSLENTLSQDYFTEKRYQALFANSVPLVFKNHNSEEYLPGPKSAIFPEDFKSPKALAEYLLYLTANQTAYGEYFDWKRSGKIKASFARALFRGENYAACRICEQFHVSHGRHNKE